MGQSAQGISREVIRAHGLPDQKEGEDRDARGQAQDLPPGLRAVGTGNLRKCL